MIDNLVKKLKFGKFSLMMRTKYLSKILILLV